LTDAGGSLHSEPSPRAGIDALALPAKNITSGYAPLVMIVEHERHG
jgi:hypothetical protein